MLSYFNNNIKTFVVSIILLVYIIIGMNKKVNAKYYVAEA